MKKYRFNVRHANRFMSINLCVLLLILALLLVDRGVQKAPLTQNEVKNEVVYVSQKITPSAVEYTPKAEAVVEKLSFVPLSKTGLTVEDYDKMLQDTDIRGYGYMFWEAEFAYGVNGLFLLALTGQEQGFGSGKIAKEKNNLTSFAAYDEDPYSNAIGFSSYSECIRETAKWLRDEYLTFSGDYFNGNTIEGVAVKYASDKDWAEKIKSVMRSRAIRIEMEVE